MKRKYGIPYMGSKNSILKEVCKLFPSADNFYDLFGGGFSVSHFMIENRGKDFEYFHYNEIREGVPKLVQDAIAGKYNYDVFKPEFITREMFFDRIDEPYVKLIWSFGNNGKNYLFGKDIEQDKKSLHNAVVFNQFDDFAKDFFGCEGFRDNFSIKERRLYCKNRIKDLKVERCDLEQLQQLQQLQQLERLQQLEQLERLQQLERLEQLQQLQRLEQLERPSFYNGDYREVKIKPNSVIYCDPPYIGTASYDGGFNHKDFYDWAHSQKCPVYISEYTLDDNRFKEVASFDKRSLLSSSKENTLIKKEKVFANRAGVVALIKRARNG